RLVDLGVLLLAVLHLVLADVLGPTLQPGVDLLLLGLAVGDEHVGERGPGTGTVGRAVAHLAQEGLEEPVIVQDEVDDVTGHGAGDVEVGHGAIIAAGPGPPRPGSGTPVSPSSAPARPGAPRS